MVPDILAERFPTLRSFPAYRARIISSRLTLQTDSINKGSLYGGVATAIILAAQLAEQSGRKLRVLTRTEPPEQENVSRILEAAEIDYRDDIEFQHSSLRDVREVEIGDDELFLTTSWWGTRSCMQTVRPDRIVYLLQEDERLFYPGGDEQLRCTETLSDERLRIVVNSRLLFDDLVAEGFQNIKRNGLWFDPAFPLKTYHYDERRDEVSNFLFYARPGNLRNLYYRGIEAIDAAVQQGVLDMSRWRIHFVGRELTSELATLPFRPAIEQDLPWSDYAALMRRMDLGLTLASMPHPSYPPLDLAASGAIAVTNRFRRKQNLDEFSKNIICTDTDVASIVEGIRAGVRLATDRERRLANYRESSFIRSWRSSMQGVVSALLKDKCS